jgi:2'-5' RNA ligase
MSFIRCFFAIALPADVKRNLAAVVVQLKKRAPMIRWAQVESIHLTLKFLGEITQVQAEAIHKALSDNAIHLPPFYLTTTQIGFFPNERKPRVIWLGLAENDILSKFQRQLEEITGNLGFEREKRSFSPHLTLGRIKSPRRFDDLNDYIINNPLPVYQITVSEYLLMRSVLKPEGAIYSPIYRYSLDINHK